MANSEEVRLAREAILRAQQQLDGWRRLLAENRWSERERSAIHAAHRDDRDWLDRAVANLADAMEP